MWRYFTLIFLLFGLTFDACAQENVQGRFYQLGFNYGYASVDNFIFKDNDYYYEVYLHKIQILYRIKSGKIDFEQSNKIKSEVGRKGELATIEHEKKRLPEELAVRIEPAFLFDDYRGYDISSYNDKDSKADEYDRRIEVKSTKDSEPHFFWSSGEIKKSMELGDQYFIYVWWSF